MARSWRRNPEQPENPPATSRRAREVLADPKQKASYQAEAGRLKLPLISVVMSDLMAKEKTRREV